jgi:putative oxidoreductase
MIMTAPSIAVKWRSWAPYLHSILRIVAAFLFMQFGTAKLFGFPAPIMPGGGTAPFGSLAWIAGFLETFGGAFLLVGLFTRPVAFLLSGEMAVAYFMGHAPQGFWPVLNQGHPAILFCFIFLYFSAAGPGPWSLDARRERRRV